MLKHLPDASAMADSAEFRTGVLMSVKHSHTCLGLRPLLAALLATSAMLTSPVWSAEAQPMSSHPLALPILAPQTAPAPLRKALESTPITLTFEGLGDGEAILNFYAGGRGSTGSGPGPNYGIVFSAAAITCKDNSVGGSCNNVAKEPSQPTLLAFTSADVATMTIANGFSGGFSFYYSAPNHTGSVVVYDGPNATGNILASLSLGLTPLGSPEQYSVWVPIGVQFSGVAKSVSFGGTANYIGFDNITLNSSVPGSPEVLPPPKIASKTVSGAPTVRNSQHVALSNDGSVSVFESQETHLVSVNNNPNGQDVYRSVSGAAAVLENMDQSNHQLIGVGGHPTVSGDGKVVAFEFAKGATKSLAKDTIVSNVWVGGAGQPKHPVDTGVQGAPANGSASNPSLSLDGKKLVFCSRASNLVANDINSAADIFLVNPSTTQAPQLISTDVHGVQLPGDSCEPRISGDGNSVVFSIASPTLYGTAARQIVRKDLISGALDLISATGASGARTAGNADSTEPSVNSDGNIITFSSKASNLDNLGAPAGGTEAFVSLRSQAGDGSRLIKRLRNGNGAVPNGASAHAQLSGSGTTALIVTQATNFFSAADAAKDIAATPPCTFVITTNFLNVTSPGPCNAQSNSQNPVASANGGVAGYDSNMPQPGTSSTNQNAYTQVLGIDPATGVPNESGDFSGQWYDPSHSGHGLVIDVLRPNPGNDARTVILTWFVYAGGVPTWVQGFGTPHVDSVGSVVVPMNVNILHGSAFPRGSSLKVEAWGTITLVFQDAVNGIMEWTSSYPGFNSGAMPIKHFQPVEFPAHDPATSKIKSCYSGNWSNPAQLGHGFEFEVFKDNPPTLSVDWFAYDPTGKPVWLVGFGPISGNTASMHLKRFDGAGAKFPPLFDGTMLTAHDWGTATFTFTDAGHASVTWNSTEAGYGAGTQPLTAGVGQLDRRTCN